MSQVDGWQGQADDDLGAQPTAPIFSSSMPRNTACPCPERSSLDRRRAGHIPPVVETPQARLVESAILLRKGCGSFTDKKRAMGRLGFANHYWHTGALRRSVQSLHVPVEPTGVLSDLRLAHWIKESSLQTWPQVHV